MVCSWVAVGDSEGVGGTVAAMAGVGAGVRASLVRRVCSRDFR